AEALSGYKVVFVAFKDGRPRRRPRTSSPASSTRTARRWAGRSAWRSTRKARCWWRTTSAIRSGASPLPASSVWEASHCRLAVEREVSMANQRPPFRADQVGSLLRPQELKRARADFKDGKISQQQLQEVEDRSIKRAISLQEAAGLQSVTDGEFRRAFWHVDFLTGFEGIAATQGQYA